MEGQEAKGPAHKWCSSVLQFREHEGTDRPRMPVFVQAYKPKRKGQTQNKKEESGDNFQQLFGRHSTKEDFSRAAS